MGVIDASLLPRWIQDPPATATGEAVVSLDATAVLSPSVSAPAALAFGTNFPVTVAVTGDAPIDTDTVLAVTVAVVGDASAGITSTAQSIDVNLTACIALAAIEATCDIAVQIDLDANIVIFDTSTFAPAVLGNATVALEDYGQGSPPLFPFTFATRFTDNPLGIQLADATITVNGFSDDVRVAGIAEAFITLTGSVALDLLGSATIFDFILPGVFSPPANVLLADAVLAFDTDCETVVSVFADASAAITSDGIRFSTMVFPIFLPAQFIS
jgi:hypothetical protein